MRTTTAATVTTPSTLEGEYKKVTGPVTAALQQKIKSGHIRDNEIQWEVATNCDRLCEDLGDGNNNNGINNTLLSKWNELVNGEEYYNHYHCPMDARNTSLADLMMGSSSWNCTFAMSRLHPKHRAKQREAAMAMAASSETINRNNSAANANANANANTALVGNALAVLSRSAGRSLHRALRWMFDSNKPVRRVYIHGSVGRF